MSPHDLLIGDKKIGVLLVLFFTIGSAYSQTSYRTSSATTRHELQMNVFNSVVLKALNVSYEHLANENLTYGLGLLYRFDTSDPKEIGFGNIEVEYRIYSVTPFIRRYFSRKHARGFFIEGFGMLNSGLGTRTRMIGNESSVTLGGSVFEKEIKKYTNFAMGITFGGKFLVGKKGVVFETNFGMGIPGVIGQRPNGFGAVTRGGVSLGYRF